MRVKARQLYIKLQRRPAHDAETSHYHIHLDARSPLPDLTVKRLLNAGFIFDFFDHNYRIFGFRGDRLVPFPSYAPNVHFTFVTPSVSCYRKQWEVARRVLSGTTTPCYLEGEFVVLDQPLDRKSFDNEAYERVSPRLIGTSATAFQYVSALDGQTRSLPCIVELRRLDPSHNGVRDRFRVAEVHLSLRDDTDPRLLELLCNLGFSAPAIPKLLEGPDGALERTENGEWKIFHDIPLTLQSMSMDDIVLVTNLAHRISEQIGGVHEGSIKIERIVNFELLNGVSYTRDIPPVIKSLRFRDDYSELSSKQVSILPPLRELARAAGRQAKTAVHRDKRMRFEEVWKNTRDKFAFGPESSNPFIENQ
jgi:hypothetical protein